MTYLHNSGVELYFNFDQMEENSNDDDNVDSECQSCHRLMMCSILKQMMIKLGTGRTGVQCPDCVLCTVQLQAISW